MRPLASADSNSAAISLSRASSLHIAQRVTGQVTVPSTDNGHHHPISESLTLQIAPSPTLVFLPKVQGWGDGGRRVVR